MYRSRENMAKARTFKAMEATNWFKARRGGRDVREKKDMLTTLKRGQILPTEGRGTKEYQVKSRICSQPEAGYRSAFDPRRGLAPNGRWESSLDNVLPPRGGRPRRGGGAAASIIKLKAVKTINHGAS